MLGVCNQGQLLKIQLYSMAKQFSVKPVIYASFHDENWKIIMLLELMNYDKGVGRAVGESKSIKFSKIV